MRLIDADKLKDYFMKCLQTTEGKDNTKERYAYMAWLRGVHAIDNAPTVDIDKAVEVTEIETKYRIKALIFTELDDNGNDKEIKIEPLCNVEVALKLNSGGESRMLVEPLARGNDGYEYIRYEE